MLMPKYKNPLQNSEKNNMCWSKANISNNLKKIVPRFFFLKVPFILYIENCFLI